ncbi:Cruciform DNA binding protein [Cytospora paraplurivora]|uniref:Cruciform DNA binding protein n=1 Tax=Cytospora paraplurivora TaxID=2898453 RepID=A0AAN9UDN9_9PEZI
MVSYTFKWPHAGEEVYVTGTFDNWSKSEKMEKVGDKLFEKSVDLPDSSDKIYYKFVVDGTWTTNPTDSHELDEGGNENNVLTPETILRSFPATTAIMSNVTEDSTTAQLANEVPLERDIRAEAEAAEAAEVIPGTFPETPAADELSKTVGISPLPAADGGLNPIKLAAGEPIPSYIRTADINSNVKLDPESYEKSDALPGLDANDLSVSPISGPWIPESSLPIGTGNLHINSVSADSTTAGLAAQVPLEPRVPEVVRESQAEAGVDPEASGLAEEVKEKELVEEELKEKVPEAPTTSEGTAGQGTDKSEGDKTLLETATATAAGLGAAAVATVVATKDKAIETAAPIAAENLPESVVEKLPVSVQETINATAKENTIETISPEVPQEVKDSIVEAGRGPEAAANTGAVEDKKAVEAELLSEVQAANPAPVENAKSEPVASEAAAPEPPTTLEQQAPQVVEPPAQAAEVPTISEPTGNGATTEATTEASNGATNGATTTANGTEPPSTPSQDKDAKPAEALTPSSPKSEKKNNRISGFFGKLKSKFSSHK